MLERLVRGFGRDKSTPKLAADEQARQRRDASAPPPSCAAAPLRRPRNRLSRMVEVAELSTCDRRSSRARAREKESECRGIVDRDGVGHAARRSRPSAESLGRQLPAVRWIAWCGRRRRARRSNGSAATPAGARQGLCAAARRAVAQRQRLGGLPGDDPDQWPRPTARSGSRGPRRRRAFDR